MLTDLQRNKLANRFRYLDVDGSGFVELADYELTADRLLRALASDDVERSAALRDSYRDLGQRLIEKMDSDGDKRVTCDEFVESCANSITNGDGFDRWIAPIADTVLGMIDTDGNGVISRDEFATWFVAYTIDQADVDGAFKRLDLDGSGTLSHAELLQALRDFYTSDDPDAPGNWLFGPPV